MRAFGPILFVLGAFAGAVSLLRPFADVFYGGDDWAYAWAVRNLLETGHFVPSPWVTATALPQALWGAAFGSAFGSSALALNLAMLSAGALGLCCLYGSARRVGCAPWTAALTAAFVGVSPHYVSFAASFMSDMHYTALMLGAVYCYLSALDRDSQRWAWAGGVLAALAFLDRQVGLCLPVAFGAGVWLPKRRGSPQTPRLPLFLAGALVPLGFVIAHRVLPEWFGGRTLAQSINTTSAVMVERLLDVPRTFSSLKVAHAYLSTLLLPLFVVLLLRSRKQVTDTLRRRPRTFAACCLAYSLLFGLHLVTRGELLARGEFLHVEHYGAELLASERLIWTLLNPLAGFASVAVVLVFFDRFAAALRPAEGGDDASNAGGRRDLAKAVFLGAALSFHVGLSTSFVTFHNNYFLPFLPLAALLAAEALRESSASPRAVDLALLGVAILVGTLAIERQFRFVEAAELARQGLIRRGVPSLEVFSHPSAYAASHNDLVIRDLERHRDEGPAAFAVFHRIRSSAAFWIGNPSIVADPRGWRRVEALQYPTLFAPERRSCGGGWLRRPCLRVAELNFVAAGS